RHFLRTVETKHASKFRSGPLANSKFVFKVVSIAGETGHGLIDSLRLSDIEFHEGRGESSRRLAMDNSRFADALYGLEVQLCALLKKMRAQCRPIFVWPRDPGIDSPIRYPREKLANELADASYRVLPEFAGNAA